MLFTDFERATLLDELLQKGKLHGHTGERGMGMGRTWILIGMTWGEELHA